MNAALRRLLLAISLAALIIAGAWGYQHLHVASTPPVRFGAAADSFAGDTMGGTWSVKLARLPAGASHAKLAAATADLLARLDRQLSIWKPDSDLSRFNQYRGTEWRDVPTDLAKLVAEAQAVSAESGGAFDVTVGPLVLLWGFGPRQAGEHVGQTPAEPEIVAARSHVNYHLLQFRLSPPALRKLDSAVYVDLGAIAKGYAAQAVADLLQSMGVADFLVAVGGELRAQGTGIDGKAWRAGIETPTPDIRRIIASVDLRNCSLSTSGDYRNFFEVAGKRFCHEIDPRTGRPVENAPASVSVVDPSGARADALATALMVLGEKDGMELARRNKIAALFILRAGDHFDFRQSPEFQRLHAQVGNRQ